MSTNIKVKGPKNSAKSLSWGGIAFSANKAGYFTVPVEAYDELSRHGFVADGDLSDDPDQSADPGAGTDPVDPVVPPIDPEVPAVDPNAPPVTE